VSRRALRALCAVPLLAGMFLGPLARPAQAAPPPPDYVAPVDAPVLDPFRPPAAPYGPGNRGLEYDTVAGTEVRAAADGVVAFAGLVAGARHVTLLHPDGLRTSYSFLDRIDVVVGQRVDQGQTLGTTAGRLHLGARAGDAYLDPASLFASRPVRVHLVPFDEPPGTGPSGERSALRQLVGGLGSLAERAVDHVLEGTGATVDWLRAEGEQVLRTAEHYLRRTVPGIAQVHLLQRTLEAWGRARQVARRPCSAPSVGPPPTTQRRVAVLVAGLGSTSTDAAIDDVHTSSLGYDDADVVRFSYAGGRTPGLTDGFPEVAATAYRAADTQVDLRLSGRRLADLLEGVASAAPDVPIDLLAHSQGGLVARLALLELERRHGREWLDRLGLVATMGTPHGGADLATAVYAVGNTRVGSTLLDAAAVAGRLELDDDATSIRQLSETSDLVRDLADAPIPDVVQAVSIAARGDLVVPVPRTAAPGAVEVVVPLDGARAHDQLPGSTAAHRELALALAGLAPTCQSLRDALIDQVVGEGISWAEDTAGSLAWLAALRTTAPLGG